MMINALLNLVLWRSVLGIDPRAERGFAEVYATHGTRHLPVGPRGLQPQQAARMQKVAADL
jgi:hypothetical protein